MTDQVTGSAALQGKEIEKLAREYARDRYSRLLDEWPYKAWPDEDFLMKEAYLQGYRDASSSVQPKND